MLGVGDSAVNLEVIRFKTIRIGRDGKHKPEKTEESR
jgi:hypothetical protein